MHFVAIDPGTVKLGYCVLKHREGNLPNKYLPFVLVEADTCAVAAKMPRLTRIKAIHARVAALLERYPPEAVVIEKVFVGKNSSSALALAEIRGAVIGESFRAGVEQIHEYGAAEARRLIGAGGNASKAKVQRIAAAILGGTSFETVDGGDAAVLCLAHVLGLSRTYIPSDRSSNEIPQADSPALQR